jgi:hypothetical protein
LEERGEVLHAPSRHNGALYCCESASLGASLRVSRSDTAPTPTRRGNGRLATTLIVAVAVCGSIVVPLEHDELGKRQ